MATRFGGGVLPSPLGGGLSAAVRGFLEQQEVQRERSREEQEFLEMVRQFDEQLALQERQVGVQEGQLGLAEEAQQFEQNLAVADFASQLAANLPADTLINSIPALSQAYQGIGFTPEGLEGMTTGQVDFAFLQDEESKNRFLTDPDFRQSVLNGQAFQMYVPDDLRERMLLGEAAEAEVVLAQASFILENKEQVLRTKMGLQGPQLTHDVYIPGFGVTSDPQVANIWVNLAEINAAEEAAASQAGVKARSELVTNTVEGITNAVMEAGHQRPNILQVNSAVNAFLQLGSASSEEDIKAAQDSLQAMFDAAEASDNDSLMYAIGYLMGGQIPMSDDKQIAAFSEMFENLPDEMRTKSFMLDFIENRWETDPAYPLLTRRKLGADVIVPASEATQAELDRRGIRSGIRAAEGSEAQAQAGTFERWAAERGYGGSFQELQEGGDPETLRAWEDYSFILQLNEDGGINRELFDTDVAYRRAAIRAMPELADIQVEEGEETPTPPTQPSDTGPVDQVGGSATTTPTVSDDMATFPMYQISQNRDPLWLEAVISRGEEQLKQLRNRAGPYEGMTPGQRRGVRNDISKRIREARKTLGGL
jgi:hypothetical protein